MKFKPIKDILPHLILIIFGFFFILPFFWMITTSFKTEYEAILFPPTWIPDKFTLEAYVTVFKKIPFLRYFFVSLVVTFFTTLGSLITSVLAAYAFSWINFKGRDHIFVFILSLMMVPIPVYVIPLYVLVQRFGWIDTYYALIIPWIVNIFAIFLLRQHFRTIPKELFEAAKIDGCGNLRFLFYVALPLIRPAIMTILVFEIIHSWNSFMWPLMVTQSDKMRVIQLGLAYFSQAESTNYPALMAASTITILPLVIVFFFAQRQIIESFAKSGLKE